MKKIIFFITFLSCLTIGQTTFKSYSLGLEAQENGTLKEYRPFVFSGHQPLKTNEKIVILTGWVKMKIMGGNFSWVWAQDEKFVTDGHNIIRRWDCGNEVEEFVPPQTPPPTPPTPPDLPTPPTPPDLPTPPTPPDLPTPPTPPTKFPWLETTVGGIIVAAIIYFFWPERSEKINQNSDGGVIGAH